MDLNKLLQDAKAAIEFSDSPEAKNTLVELKRLLIAYNISQTDPALHKRILDLVIKLNVVAFTGLSDKDSEEVLRQYYLESFEIDFPIENAVTEKLFLVPYGERKELQERLRQAFLQNNQTLGNLKVGQWLKLFDQTFDPKIRNASSILQFIVANNYARQLNNADREKLKKTLHLYDSLLIYTPLTVDPDEKNLLRAFAREISQGSTDLLPEKKITRGNITARDEQKLTGAVEQKEIKDALKSNPKLGEQLITTEQLNLKYFDRPVRPSIRNWLYDYTSHLGQTGHSSMDRTNYLFRSENTRNLSSQEREKLGIILKSFDESTPLPVDASRNEVVFGSLTARGAEPETRAKLPAPPMRQAAEQPKTPQETFVKPYPKPGTREPRLRKPAENISNISFAKGLPKPRKAVSQPGFLPQPQTKSAIPPKMSFARPRKNIIEPMGRARPEPKIEGNVVDLSMNNDQRTKNNSE